MIRVFKRLCLAAALVVAIAAMPRAQAQQAAPSPAAMTTATELLDVLGMEKQFEAIMPLLLQQVRMLITQTNPQAAKEIDAVMPLLADKFKARKSEVVPLAAQIYARRLSIEDMKAMTSFFKTPAGQRFVESMPQLTQESMAIGQEWGRRLGEEVDREMRDELRKRGVKI